MVKAINDVTITVVMLDPENGYTVEGKTADRTTEKATAVAVETEIHTHTVIAQIPTKKETNTNTEDETTTRNGGEI